VLAAALVDAAGAPAAAGPGSAGEIVLLAVVQALTEFLPISSSGHLVLARAWLGMEGGGLLQSVALHVGTLIAVVAVYLPELRALLRDTVAGRPRLLLLLVLGTLPAVAVGFGFREGFASLFEDPDAAAAGLLATAAILVWGERGRRRRAAAQPAAAQPAAAQPAGAVPERELRWRDALLVGTGQALAILPGVSRSGTTIATGLRLGLPPEQAARFSFLLSIPAVGGAALLEGVEALGGEAEGGGGVGSGVLLLGVAVSAVVGWAALKLLLVLLRRGVFLVFAAWCAALGAAWLLLG